MPINSDNTAIIDSTNDMIINNVDNQILNNSDGKNLEKTVMNTLNNCQTCNGSCNGNCNNKNSCMEKCKTDPSSCGGGAGGYRLETGFIDATTSPDTITVDENTIYPDSYVGSYWTNPKPDISQPYPIIINRV